MLSTFTLSLISCETPPEDAKSKENAKISKRKETDDVQRDIEDIKNEVIKERGNLFFYSKEFNEAEKTEKEMKENLKRKYSGRQ